MLNMEPNMGLHLMTETMTLVKIKSDAQPIEPHRHPINVMVSLLKKKQIHRGECQVQTDWGDDCRSHQKLERGKKRFFSRAFTRNITLPKP